MASDNKKVAALGRPFTLGMLYDARRDELIPGLTLWDDKTLQSKIAETSQRTSAFQISTSDSTESRCKLLDVEASLKASFLGGLIEVGGSAKYLDDKKTFHNQSRVTCQYKATTNFKQLMIDHLPKEPQQMEVIKKSSATHVVTGITYGANAFFVFDSEKLETSSVQDIQGSMHAVIKKIPSLSIEGQAKLKLSDEQKALTKKLSCKFFGDLILDSNPATFEDAVKAYEQLPKLLKKKGENSVPVQVWLMPLKNFTSGGAELKKEISHGVVGKAQNNLDKLREMGMRCNDSLEDKVVQQFPVIRKELSTFQKLCGNYASNLKQALKEKLPSIREGKEDERSLNQLFEDRDKSPFSQDKLTKWLDRKEREINVIRSCVDTMEGTKIVPNRRELDKVVLAPGAEDVLCFVFTSVERGDTNLDVMADYLDFPKLGSTNEAPWFYSDEVFTKMRGKAKAFNLFAKGLKNNSRFRFLIATIANKNYTGATIYHYKNGRLVNQDFTKPVLPPVETIKDRRDLIWYACDLNLDPNTANGWLTLSEGNKKATCGEWRSYPDRPQRFDNTQVLCVERLSGKHYWEFEWNDCPDESIYAAVAYSEIERKSNSRNTEFGGGNTISWAFGKYAQNKERSIRAWHNCKVWSYSFPSDGCSRVGVYLDWPAGTLSFYRVSSNTLRHLYTFRTRFTEPVHPGFWVYNTSNYVKLCPVK